MDKKRISFMENDVIWNALGSMMYALASMILAFFVLRLLGEREGGIFGVRLFYSGAAVFYSGLLRDSSLSYYGYAGRVFLSGVFGISESELFACCFLRLAVSSSIKFLVGNYSAEKSSILFFLCLY